MGSRDSRRGLAGFPHPWEPHTSPGLGLGREKEDTAPPPLPVSLFSVSLAALSSFPKTECKGHSLGTTSQKTRRTRDEVSGETPDKGVTFSASDSRASGREVGGGLDHRPLGAYPALGSSCRGGILTHIVDRKPGPSPEGACLGLGPCSVGTPSPGTPCGLGDQEENAPHSGSCSPSAGLDHCYYARFSGKSDRFGFETPWVWTHVSHLTACVTLGKSLTSPPPTNEPQFPHVPKGF